MAHDNRDLDKEIGARNRGALPHRGNNVAWALGGAAINCRARSTIRGALARHDAAHKRAIAQDGAEHDWQCAVSYDATIVQTCHRSSCWRSPSGDSDKEYFLLLGMLDEITIQATFSRALADAMAVVNRSGL